MPGKLRAAEVAYGRRRGRRWLMETAYSEALTAADLSTDARGRLLERADLRARRVLMSHRHVREDLYWIASELALVLPAAHPNVAIRWRDEVRRWLAETQRLLDQLVQLEAQALLHDGDTEGWLRRQLAPLARVEP